MGGALEVHKYQRIIFLGCNSQVTLLLTQLPATRGTIRLPTDDAAFHDGSFPG